MFPFDDVIMSAWTAHHSSTYIILYIYVISSLFLSEIIVLPIAIFPRVGRSWLSFEQSSGHREYDFRKTENSQWLMGHIFHSASKATFPCVAIIVGHLQLIIHYNIFVMRAWI